MAKSPTTQSAVEPDFDAPTKKFLVSVLDTYGRPLKQYANATLVKAEHGQLEFLSSGAKLVVVNCAWMIEEE